MADIKGKILILGSVYGPNEHNPAFFVNLKNDISSLGNVPVILGETGIVRTQLIM